VIVACNRSDSRPNDTFFSKESLANFSADDYNLYKHRTKNVDELYERILKVWNSIDRRIIDAALLQ